MKYFYQFGDFFQSWPDVHYRSKFCQMNGSIMMYCVFVWTNQFDNYYRCHQNHKSIQRVLEQHIKSFIPFITGPLWGQNHFICAFEFWNSDNLKKSLLAVLFRQIWIHWKELMNISSHFGNFYLIQLIDQPILRIQSFKFPNLRCCIVFLFFCV